MIERDVSSSTRHEKRSAAAVRLERHRAAMAARSREAAARAKALGKRRVEVTEELGAVTARLDSLPQYLHGWAVELVVALGIIAFALEWYPARLVAYAFDVTDAASLYLMTAAIAFAGWLSGFIIGDIAWRHRKPQQRAPLYTFALVLATVAAVVYLWMGYENRLTYASLVIDGSAVQMLAPWKLALSLTGLSALGIALACLTGIMRESKEAAILRRTANRLDHELEACNKQQTAAESEREEHEAAYGEAYEPKAPADAPAVATAGTQAPAGAPAATDAQAAADTQAQAGAPFAAGAPAPAPAVPTVGEDVQLTDKVSANHVAAGSEKGRTS
jgi:hypothetical protein